MGAAGGGLAWHTKAAQAPRVPPRGLAWLRAEARCLRACLGPGRQLPGAGLGLPIGATTAHKAGGVDSPGRAGGEQTPALNPAAVLPACSEVPWWGPWLTHGVQARLCPWD